MDFGVGRKVALAYPAGLTSVRSGYSRLMTLQRTGVIILPMTKGVTVAGKLDAASAVEYGQKYSEDQERDETGKWVTGTAHLSAYFHDAKYSSAENAGKPMHVEVTHYVGRGDAAKPRAAAIAASFPKSAGVRASTLSGVPGPNPRPATGASNEEWGRWQTENIIHTVSGHVQFTPDKTTGDLNETGAKRYERIVSGFEKLGIPVEVNPDRLQGGNAYASRAEFEAALAKHMGKKSIDDAMAAEYKGDVAGHEFHGNRYTGGISGARDRGDGDRSGWPGLKGSQYAYYMGGGCAEFAAALQQEHGLKVALMWGADNELTHAYAYDGRTAYDAGGRDTVGNLESMDYVDHVERDVAPARLASLAADGKINLNESAIADAREAITSG